LIKRLNILNLWVDVVTMDQILSLVTGYVENGTRPHCIFAVNPEKNFSVPKDPELYKIFNSADLLIPDGIGIVLAARILHGIRLSRVAGADLMHAICELSAQKGYKVFVYGGQEYVNKGAVEQLSAIYPGLIITGRANGYVKQEIMEDLIQKINSSGAQILLLALGSPKQEKWFATYKHDLKGIRVCQGVGGTLDTVVGRVRRAPKAWQKIGMEWLYRLLSDPKRIKRQRVLPLFTALVLLSKVKSLASEPSHQGGL